MSEALPLPIDEQGRLDADVLCRQCGFNLRGLSTTGTCPECGAAVEASLAEDTLAFAEPHWLTTLTRGVTILLVAVLVSIPLGMLGGALGTQLPQAGALSQLLDAGLTVLQLVGIWMLTTPEPTEDEKQPRMARVLARWGMVASGVLAFAGAGVMVSGEVIPGGGFVVAGSLGVASGIAALIGTFAMFVYARRLAERMPDAKLAGQTWIVMWGYAISMGVMIFGGLLALLAMRAGGAGGGGGVAAAASVACLGGAGYLVFTVWTLVLLVQYRTRFVRLAELARGNWRG